MSPKLKNLLLTMSFMISSLACFAQATGTGGPPPPPPTGDRMPPSLPGLIVPIDENIKILLIMGLIVGILYFFKNRLSKA